ncbi:hypothetical protein EhV314 [Emiliania huxleyi virus 86]|uniref:Uncharacterized protein n=1 Tax=Emiliania huxleyi virus 86 (isolate United Kingdom/English Channel/1999) TaxID=654925 RepID=Q4A2G5_EHV8U|nr:hypothetical protein EhV314 [Emiliania huxleyi virus 86]AEO97764.1 hypothetical protein ENVG_00231 [Emiliania huxleyi virus 84]AEP15242.1 hypothetical protein EOVG_00305 [Emiliania huxleyi virus 88]AHA54922.1 hypothetical protein EhV145_00372 [Emiliania huxleyi virus 145]AHA55932.1 hypothetical protein EhV164_00345 [Emiliania huxleyi virus 164]CAI65741.1 hypothetical protein EhV314 [Emiliania huxleyi virus 86]|mmetsp:Transcript_16707/g.48382  ORF Transcript_16707/g.48382 Transcript_16707/m.48382 type:complete len:172 (+) Transcript_16707:641-1156(+)
MTAINVDNFDPEIDEIDEIDETDNTDNTDIHDAFYSLAEKVTSNLTYDLENAIIDASELLIKLRKKQRSIKKKAKRIATGPKVRATYGSGVPSCAQLFAKSRREQGATWYENGGRVDDFNPGRSQQIAKFLANLWKDASREIRDEFDDMRNGIIARKEELRLIEIGDPIAV